MTRATARIAETMVLVRTVPLSNRQRTHRSLHCHGSIPSRERPPGTLGRVRENPATASVTTAGPLPNTPAAAAPVIPAGAGQTVGDRSFGAYVHVPFCTRRCGYCDFNTYTLGQAGKRRDYLDALALELGRAGRDLAGRDLASAPPRHLDTVFVGGGTPTTLAPDDLARILDRLDSLWGLAEGAEVTIEANPESVTPSSLAALRVAGFTRVSFGMQSTAAHVLALLDRAHSARGAQDAVGWALEAGFEHVSVDLIYGTPGESPEDFSTSLADAIACGVDHVSAYALTIEERTPLGSRMRRGQVPYPDDDEAADRYVLADQTLARSGFDWYEISNWAREAGARCRHNLGYWRGADWWGFGPGAHSHVGGVRWWNVRRPEAYAARLSAGESPVEDREVLTEADRQLEAVFLGLRLAEGLELDRLDAQGRQAAADAASDGLLETAALSEGRAVLTVRGRLLADAVTRRLIAGTFAI